MHSVNLSNSLFQQFNGQDSRFIQALATLRNQRLTVPNMQKLRKFSKQVIANLQLFNEGKDDIVNQYGTDAVNEAGEITGKEIKADNTAGIQAYNDLLQISNSVEIDTLDLSFEKEVSMSDVEYETLVFLFEAMPVGDESVDEPVTE